ncbi:MAG: lipoprotein insertase outer membrane protein LolB [Gammaproteobacteria bacterium]|nr:lipoprotein insertase outer membrane protein LolB [Gammaproteobacteria bacterium]
MKICRLNGVSGRVLVLLLAALLVGCATHSVAPALDAEAVDRLWESRQAQLGELAGWQMKGRVAVKSEQDSWSASMSWQQQAEAFDIRFSSMLGQRMAQLKGDALTASLYLPDDRVLSASNVSELLDDELGWSVPMDGLRYWLVGMPAPMAVGKSNKALDELGRLQWLEQSGWRIEYQRYRAAGILEVPKKMVLTRNDLRVRLVIDRWQAVAAAQSMIEAHSVLPIQPRIR